MSGTAPSPLPQYVYKIIPTAPPEPLPTPYPLSELDQQDGFVHLSTGSQIPITAGLFFKETTELWVLKVKFAPRFEKDTNWDVPGCPHLYGNFGAQDVEAARRFGRKEDQSWEDALAVHADWFE